MGKVGNPSRLIAGVSLILALLSATLLTSYHRFDATLILIVLFSTTLLSSLAATGFLVHYVSRTEHSGERLRLQLAVTSALAQCISVDDAIENILSAICQSSKWQVGVYWALSEQENSNGKVTGELGRDSLVFECKSLWADGGVPNSVPNSNFVNESESAIANSRECLPGVGRKRPMWLSEVSKAHYFVASSSPFLANCGRGLSFPIVCGTQLCGVMEFYTDELRQEDPTLLELVTSFGTQIGQLIAREKANELAHINEGRFLEVAENVNDIFWICGPYGIPFHYVSPAYEKIWGRTVEELYRNPRAWLNYVLEEDREKLAPFISLEQTPAGVQVEYRIRRSDGSIRWMCGTCFPVRSSLGKDVRSCGVIQDITDRKEAEQRVREFYSTVSHELRTPLTSIKASLGLVTNGVAGDVPDEAIELLHIAASECDRLIRLINDILDLRKIEAGKLELKLMPACIVEMAEQSQSTIAAAATEQNVVVTTNISCRGKIRCDKDRILQVLANLLSNAVKFSAAGGAIEIGVCQPCEGRVRFHVRDFGPGIEASQMGKLFCKFQQLDSSDTRSKEGTGLGLAISKAIVEQHAGLIGVDTVYGEGSTFWFEIPGALQIETEEYIKPSRAMLSDMNIGRRDPLPG